MSEASRPIFEAQRHVGKETARGHQFVNYDLAVVEGGKETVSFGTAKTPVGSSLGLYLTCRIIFGNVAGSLQREAPSSLHTQTPGRSKVARYEWSQLSAAYRNQWDTARVHGAAFHLAISRDGI